MYIPERRSSPHLMHLMDTINANALAMLLFLLHIIHRALSSPFHTVVFSIAPLRSSPTHAISNPNPFMQLRYRSTALQHASCGFSLSLNSMHSSRWAFSSLHTQHGCGTKPWQCSCQPVFFPFFFFLFFFVFWFFPSIRHGEAE